MRLYDTLSRKAREFVPASDTVTFYVCGITPYAPCHMGHAMSYVTFDVLRRYLEFQGYEVNHVQNFTDIDDRIIERSQREGISPEELTGLYIEEYMVSMEALNVKRANAYPRATQQIPNIVRIIQTLEEQGYAYPSMGDVYFRVHKTSDYGKLSHRTLEKMIPGARVEVTGTKEHPMDFTLWKAAKEREPAWDSPWGPGRPGWHIECTAMALDYLGETLDIHGGGQDLVFPHHENEIAQSEAYTGTAPFVQHWVHNGLLQLGEDKMSKSLGNLVTLEEALKRFTSDALRIFILSSYYRSPLTYSEESLESAERAATRLRNALRQGSQEGVETMPTDVYKKRFCESMDADLNTPQALSVLFELARDINRHKESGNTVARAQEALQELGGVLGLTFTQLHLEERVPIETLLTLEGEVSTKLLEDGLDSLAKGINSQAEDASAAEVVRRLVKVREELRVSQQYTLADHIRNRLQDVGIALEDTSSGTLWEYQP